VGERWLDRREYHLVGHVAFADGDELAVRFAALLAACARAIGDWLIANAGRPNRGRRRAAEPFGTASL
jgi:hypothetical protein